MLEALLRLILSIGLLHTGPSGTPEPRRPFIGHWYCTTTSTGTQTITGCYLEE
jgi:hypothetical protein